MKFDRLISRVKGMLLSPRSEWPQVAAEPTGIMDMYKRYVIVLAAIPAVFQFIKGSVIGYNVLYTTLRIPVGNGLLRMVLEYVLSLVMVFLMALLVDALAPTFGGKRDRGQAFKTVAYAWTAVWVVGIAMILPWAGTLMAILGGLYSIYLLYVGLPHTMGCPQGKRLGYTVTIIVASLVLSVVASMMAARMAGTRALLGGMHRIYTTNDAGPADPKDIVGSLNAVGRSIQAARGLSGGGAGKHGNGASQDAAGSTANPQSLGDMFAQATERNRQRAVAAVAPARLKSLLPGRLGDLTRKTIAAQRNSAMGMQNSKAEARYENDDGHRLKVLIEDNAALMNYMTVAGAMASESEKQTDHGYSRRYRHDGRMIEESWDDRSRNGKYSMLVGNRFNVTISGKARDMAQIKSVMQALDLARLEAWGRSSEEES